MKTILLAILTTTLFFSCDDDGDGSSTTGNTEYFKYTIDGVERIFDHQIEAHLETDTRSDIDRYEINATGLNGEVLRTIAGTFSFSNSSFLMTNTDYDWNIAANTSERGFLFAEITPSNFLFIPSNEPITTTITSLPPNNVGDYIEFIFSGTYIDDNGVLRTISGECRVKRGVDQNF